MNELKYIEMQKMKDDLLDNVQDVSAENNTIRTDYGTELIPFLNEKAKTNKKFRMIYQLGNDYTRFDMVGLLDDAKKALKNISAWDRIALVSDNIMINSFAKFFRHLTSCELRLYKNEEIEKAKDWITE